MTDQALQQLWKTYQDAWADISQSERSKLLGLSLAQDVVYTNPDGEERGVEGMVANITAFQAQYNGCYFRTSVLRQQHGQLLSAWTMFDRNDVSLVNGHSYARFDEQQARLTYLAGFWKV